MSDIGFVEVVTPEFVLGWTSTVQEKKPLVLALLNGELIGWSQAAHRRKDLATGAGFAIAFSKPVPESDMDKIEVVVAPNRTQLRRLKILRAEDTKKLQLFVLGSPRSGTSQIGRCIAEAFELPWLGEGHVAPVYASALDALRQVNRPPTGFMAIVEAQGLEDRIISRCREAYFLAHASQSFLDKTPGTMMIRAAPALLRAFPEAKLIFAKRNGISNVLSRMKKFGGTFEAHCNDWAAAMRAWVEVRKLLPNFIEIQQEKMATDPQETAAAICKYIGNTGRAEILAAKFTTHSEERTGAGIGRTSLSSTGWSAKQVRTFIEVCGEMMELYGYEIEV